MPQERFNKDSYANFSDIYKYVEADLNAEYKERKKGKGRRIKDSIDSFNGKDFLFNMGKFQMVGYIQTKLLTKRNSNKKINTRRTGYVYYTMLWKTNKGRYRVDLDRYYRKKYMYNILQLKREYEVL